MIAENNIWNIVGDFFKTHGLVHQQTQSFDEYIRNIPDIISEETDISIDQEDGNKYVIQFMDTMITNPGIIEEDRNLKLIYPANARNRDLTYDSAICCDIVEKTYDKDNKLLEEVKHNRVIIGRTPIMLRSCKCNLTPLSNEERIKQGECEWDSGGYFIIRGHERVIVPQLRGDYNRVSVLKQKKGEKHSHIAEIRSMSEETGHSVQLKAMIGVDDRTIVFSLPYIKEVMHVGIIFKALGFTSDEDITNLINLNSPESAKYIRTIIRDSFFIEDQDQALMHIGQYSVHIIPKERRRAYAWQVVETELFPHMGVSATVKEKAILLGSMVKKLLLTRLGIRSPDDRDNYAKKRIDTCGILCADLFRTLFKRFINTIKLQLDKKKSRVDIVSIIGRINSITQGLKHSFGTGNWGVQKNSYIKTGVSQVLSRLTYGATLSHTRRIIINTGKECKNAGIRQIHASQFAYICPSETPEGQSAGIVLNFALLARVTRKTPTSFIKEILEDSKYIIPTEEFNLSNSDTTFVLLNGILMGMTEDPEKLIEDVKTLRKLRRIDPDVSITYDMIDDEIRIFCDAGRITRPFFSIGKDGINISKDDEPKWDDLAKSNKIEYVDSSEIENCVIAMTQADIKKHEHNYCEIHPSMLLGVMGGIIPFADHSPSPRNCYQCSMGKQAIGLYAMSYKSRTDTITHVLDSHQRPLVSTKPSEFMGFNDMPSGLNAIVAIMTYTGYNQEDSVILNKSSIDRGMFMVTSFRTITEVEKPGGMYIVESICVPPPSSNGVEKGEPGYFRRKNGNFSLLDERGVVRKGINVKQGDIIIGKILTKSTKTGEDTVTDCSISVKSGEEGIVDKVFMSTTPNGYKMVKIVIRKQRRPEIGDKFASRAAQKGTVGAIYNQADMPFNLEGINPDIIVNPHAMPSRMTTNQLMECVLGKACAIGGMYGDSTPFSSSSQNNAAERICDLLAKVGMQEQIGYNRNGWEVMRCGFTGEIIKARIFMGPTYYQRLKHMVSDKMHSRAQGHVTTLTRQPLEGRSRDGGLRFGEMERDCIISHGASRFLKERLYDCSDPYTIIVCNHCGMITSSPDECSACQKDQVKTCIMPYASKLLLHNLTAMGIKTAIKVK